MLTQNTFTGGVISPWINSRNELLQHRKGLAVCENFICTPYGALRRRMGSHYCGTTVGKARLIPFQLSSDVGYVLEFSATRLRVYKECNLIAGVDLVTPYTVDEIYDLQFVKINAVMLLTHKNHPPQELRFNSESSWSFSEASFDYPPFRDFLLDGNEITVTAAATTPLEYSEAFNLADNDPAVSSTPVSAIGSWEVDVTTFTPNGGPPPPTPLVTLQLSTDGGENWSDLQTIVGTGVVTGTQVGGLLRISSLATAVIGTLKSSNDVPDLAEGDTVDVSLDSAFFESGHVDSEFEISHTVVDREKRIALSSADTISEQLDVQGTWQLTTNGIWQGTVFVEKSDDNGETWELVLKRTAASDANYRDSGEERDGTLMRVRFESAGAGDQVPTATISNDGELYQGRIKILTVTDSQNATAAVISRIYSEDSTEFWKEGAWSDKNGFPAAIAWHESRIFYGGSKADPSTIWGSQTDDFYNFEEGTNADEAFHRQIATDELTDIVWLLSHRELYIGTTGEEWRGFSDSDVGVITPASFILRRISNSGSDPVSPILAGSSVVHVQRQGRSLYQIVYDPASPTADGYIPADLSLLAPHVTIGKVTSIAYQAIRDSIIWATTGNGKLIGLTFDREQNVAAWHEHTGGLFNSVATVYEGGSSDSVYVSVERAGANFIERFVPDQYDLIETGDQSSERYTDSTVDYSGPATTVFSGLSHLEGQTVQLVSDGVLDSNTYTVSGGQITAASSFTNAYVGLPITAQFELLPISFQGSEGSWKRASKVILRTYKSVGFEVKESIASSKAWEPYRQTYRTHVDPNESETVNQKGDLENMEQSFKSSMDQDSRVAIRTVEPYPLNVLAVTMNVELGKNK